MDFNEKLDEISKNKFFSLSKPYLSFIDKGNIFSIMYYIMAIINLIIPFVVLYQVIDSRLFSDLPAKYIFAFVLVWIVIVFACWIGFQLWWNRQKKVVALRSSEFSAILNFSELLQVFGEWLGTMIGIIGLVAGLFATIFLGSDMNYLFRYIGLDFLAMGPVIILAGPIIGFSIIILFKFFAELLRLWASLVDHTRENANHTKEIAESVKK